jgi:hypothetical protein
MASSSTTPTATNNQINTLNNETAVYEYMRQFVDYQENGVNLNELSQIRQLDIYLQSILFVFLCIYYQIVRFNLLSIEICMIAKQN